MFPYVTFEASAAFHELPVVLKIKFGGNTIDPLEKFEGLSLVFLVNQMGKGVATYAHKPH